jgi:septum formation protein
MRRTLILGSSSPWRQQVLREAGYTFETLTSNFDEKSIRHNVPDRLVKAISFAKANDLMPKVRGREALLITADQVAYFGGEVLEKPANEEQARSFLRAYRDRYIAFYSAILITDVATRESYGGVDVSIVEVDHVTERAIEAAVLRGDVLKACGAFVLEDPAIAPHVRLTSGSVSSCQGMPLNLFRVLLAKHGYRKA